MTHDCPHPAGLAQRRWSEAKKGTEALSGRRSDKQYQGAWT